jgi:NADH dehydrogenase FAD-containing subunit
MTRQVVILGAGFGGLELSTLLCERLPTDVEVTLIDQNDAFCRIGIWRSGVSGFGRRRSPLSIRNGVG